MKRVASVSGGQGADNGKTGLFIEYGIAYDQRRTSSLLLMTGLGEKVTEMKSPFLGT
jgi:hypothetical protein